MIFGIALLACIGCWATISREKTGNSHKSEFVIATVEALSRDENSGSNNTGPREKEKCYKGKREML